MAGLDEPLLQDFTEPITPDTDGDASSSKPGFSFASLFTRKANEQTLADHSREHSGRIIRGESTGDGTGGGGGDGGSTHNALGTLNGVYVPCLLNIMASSCSCASAGPWASSAGSARSARSPWARR